MVKDIPVLHPKSREYQNFWRAEKQKCVEGMWSSGKWMPGALYFYVNYWHILLNKSKYSKVKSLGKPYLRDIEWDKAYVYTEAKGFSGFIGDLTQTCNQLVRDILNECDPDHKDFEYAELDQHPEYVHISKNCFMADGSLKEYTHPRAYLRKYHGFDMGSPLYENQAKNAVDIECRGSGKSYWASGGMIGHNFLMDGATNYQEYLDAWKEGKPLSSETLVGAINTSYSADLLSKFSLGLESLEGGIKVGSQYFPSPLFKQTKGTLAPGKNPLYAAYDKKEGGTWQEVGSRSKIHHRSFKDKPTAGNGTRPGLVILEEVGFMGNLKDALGPLRMCTADGAVQFGTTYMFGTGGDMDGGSTQAVMEVFFEPEAWDCLAFPDYYESDGSRNIGYFVPYTLGLNQYKDDEGNTDIPAAEAFVKKTRERLAKASSKKPLNDELQNNPVVPSEAFLVTSGNIFPIKELQDQLSFVQASTTDFVKGQLGTLMLTPNMEQGVKWVPDMGNKLEVASYPVPKGADMVGCVQIWEHPPSGQIPRGMYIAGTDPYDQDKAGESSSLGSTFIYKIGDFRQGGIRDMVVAEYTGRPDTAKEHHENVRRLCMYFNALNLYENEKNSMKFHFEANNSLYLLSNTPSILKANASGTVQRTYGQHMTAPIKSELEIFARDWLSESRGDGMMNLNQIYSLGLLKELVMYNDTGNFDRVISFMLLICNRLQHHNVVIEEKKEIEIDTFFTRKHFT
jgi:hypothetical protein